MLQQYCLGIKSYMYFLVTTGHKFQTYIWYNNQKGIIWVTKMNVAAAIFSTGIKSYMRWLKWHITLKLLSYYYVWCTDGNVVTWLCNITVLIRKDFLSIYISSSANIKILFVIFLIDTTIQLWSINTLLMIKAKED